MNYTCTTEPCYVLHLKKDLQLVLELDTGLEAVCKTCYFLNACFVEGLVTILQANKINILASCLNIIHAKCGFPFTFTFLSMLVLSDISLIVLVQAK